MNYKKDFGKKGEELASKYLKNNGYEVINQNFRCKLGEIDLIAIKNNTIIFIEVKTRSNTKFGTPEQAVDSNKRKHILRTSQVFLAKNKLNNYDLRFDIISIYMNGNIYKIEHFKNIEIV